MILTIVVAQGLNREIGKGNSLLWHLSADLKFFKSKTLGKPVIMGRKTYESIGKPLPNRRNIVLSRNSNTSIEGVEIYSSLQEALEHCHLEEEVMIIGGDSIYQQSLPLVHQIWLTQVNQSFSADAFFPSLSADEWELTWESEIQEDEKSGITFSFKKFERKK